jgi:hypothetical protein
MSVQLSAVGIVKYEGNYGLTGPSVSGITGLEADRAVDVINQNNWEKTAAGNWEISLVPSVVSGQISGHGSSISSLSAAIDAIDEGPANIAFLSGAIDDNTSDISSLSSAIDNNTTDIATNSADIISLSGGLAGATSAEIAFLSGSIDINTSDISYLSGEIDGHTSDISILSSAIDTNTSDIGTNTTDIATNSGDIGALSAAIDAIDEGPANIAFLSGAIDDNTTDIIANSADIIILSAAIDVNSSDIGFLSGNIDGLVSDIGFLSGNIDGVIADLGSLSGAIDDNSLDIIAISGEVGYVSGEVALNDIDIDSLSAAIDINTGLISGGLSGGIAPYKVVVDAAGGGNYTSVGAAVSSETSGTTIFIRNGTYSESANIQIKSGQSLIGESPRGVVLDFTGTTGYIQTGSNADHDALDIEHWNTNLTVTENSSVVSAIGGFPTTFISDGITAGMHIVFHNVAHEIASVDSETVLTLVDQYEGESTSGVHYWAGDYVKDIYLSNFTITGTNAPLHWGALSLQGCVKTVAENIIVRDMVDGSYCVEVELAGDSSFSFLELKGQQGGGIRCRTPEATSRKPLMGINIKADRIHGGEFGAVSMSCAGYVADFDFISSSGSDGIFMSQCPGTIVKAKTIENCFRGLNTGFGFFESVVEIDMIRNCVVGAFFGGTFGSEGTVTLKNIYGAQTSTYGVHFGGGANDISLVVGNIKDFDTAGIFLEGGIDDRDNIIVINGTITDNDIGLLVQGHDNKFIINGHVEGNTSYDLLIDGGGGDNNVFQGGTIGVIENTAGPSVSGNKLCGVTFTSIVDGSDNGFINECRSNVQGTFTSPLSSPGLIRTQHANRTINLNSVSGDVGVFLRMRFSSLEIGNRWTFVKSGSGDVVIHARNTVTIGEGDASTQDGGPITKGATGQIYNETAAETNAVVVLEYFDVGRWVVVNREGTWVTT